VNDVAVLAEAWEQEAFVSRALGNFDDVLTVASAQELIESNLPLGAARLFNAGAFLPERLLARPPGRRGRTARRVVDSPSALRQIEAGATLAVEELQLYSDPVAELCRAVSAETGYDTDATLFLTPARATGAGPHRDPVSFFLRQVHGVKRWRVWPAETGADRPRPAVIAETAPELDVILKEGDCIYIPRGRVHLGETFAEPSLHLSIGVFQITWARALADLVAGLGTELEQWQQLVPSRLSAVDPDDLLAERITQLVGRLATVRWSMLDPGRQPAHQPAPVSLQAALDRYDGGAAG
jgi:hypothetical protein